MKITENKIYNPKVKNDIKISFLGDIHISRLVGENLTNNLIYELNIEHPNYICFVGDIIDNPTVLLKEEKLNQLTNFIKESSKVAPTMIVLGSHDFVSHKTEDEFIMDFWNEVNTYDNVHLLNDDVYKDNNILFMGYRLKEDYYFNKIKNKKEDLDFFYNDLIKYPKLYKDLPKDTLNIGLIHSPEYVNDKRNVELLKDYDLLVSGHNHEGCMPAILDDIIPGNRGIINSKKSFFPKFTRGITKLESGSDLLVTGGVVKMSNSAPMILRPLDHLCYRQMDTVTFTNKQQEKTYQKTIKRKYMKK